MIIREEIGDEIYFLPLKSMEDTFLKDFRNLRIFIQSCSQTYKHGSLITTYQNVINAIDDIGIYPYPLLIVKKLDLIFIRDILKSMISTKVNNKFGKIKRNKSKKSIEQGINFLNSIITG